MLYNTISVYQCFEREVLVEESAAAVAVALENEPVSVVAHVAAELTRASDAQSLHTRQVHIHSVYIYKISRVALNSKHDPDTGSSRGRRAPAAGGGSCVCARYPSASPWPRPTARPRSCWAPRPWLCSARASRARAAAPRAVAPRSRESPHPPAASAAARASACSRCAARASGEPGSRPDSSTRPIRTRLK